MSRFRLFLWVIIGLFLGESLTQKLNEKEYFEKQYLHKLPEVHFKNEVMEVVPDSFDSRSKWPKCVSIGQISDQGSCESCWAISAVDTMTDRICIHSQGKHTYRLSAANLINCCVKCADNSYKKNIPGGCGGGNHAEAWKYWINNGIVTGGPYDSNEGCQPYEFEPCKHYTDERYTINEPRQTCKAINDTPNCKHTCQPLYGKSYSKDKNYGKVAYTIKPNELAIRTEIFHNGPVQATMQLFDDFKNYESGIYNHTNGNYTTMHAVRIIGWDYTETNTPYWLVANSYNTDWGENGFFRIRRGINEYSIESNVIAGMPHYRRQRPSIISFWKKITHRCPLRNVRLPDETDIKNLAWKILGLP